MVEIDQSYQHIQQVKYVEVLTDTMSGMTEGTSWRTYTGAIEFLSFIYHLSKIGAFLVSLPLCLNSTILMISYSSAGIAVCNTLSPYRCPIIA